MLIPILNCSTTANQAAGETAYLGMEFYVKGFRELVIESIKLNYYSAVTVTGTKEDGSNSVIINYSGWNGNKPYPAVTKDISDYAKISLSLKAGSPMNGDRGQCTITNLQIK